MADAQYVVVVFGDVYDEEFPTKTVGPFPDLQAVHAWTRQEFGDRFVKFCTQRLEKP